MLSVDDNYTLTHVGPGTPMGELLRRYWYPLAASSELQPGQPAIRRRILGENLALYRLPDGTIGAIQEACPHRRASLAYGVVEETGIRCPYHGWLFDRDGRCVEQPAEPRDSAFKDRISARAYLADELGGMIFVYMGPKPAPLIPAFDAFMWPNVWRELWYAVLPMNWLQVMENSMDPHHVEWLHGRYADYVQQRSGAAPKTIFGRKHVKVAFDEFEYGIVKRRLLEGQSEDDDDWKVGHPVVFPHMLRVGFAWRHQFQIRVPMDDENTLHLWYNVYKPPTTNFVMAPQECMPVTEIPIYTADGDYRTDFIDGQDIMAWATQGRIVDRSVEHLGTSDIGIIKLRKMFWREMDRLNKGEDPMGVIREPVEGGIINLPQEGSKKLGLAGASYWRSSFEQGTFRFSPIRDQIRSLFEQFQEIEERAGAS